tara:strand:- start:1734 stop:2036 length:303 start_codon:yes stop_codon:yes gene_type:complete
MPLGLFITNLGGIGGPLSMGDTGGSVVIEDYYWEIHVDAGAGYFTPLEKDDVIPGAHDTWQLITIGASTGHYQPRAVGAISDEGYWEVTGADDDVRPVAV